MKKSLLDVADRILYSLQENKINDRLMLKIEKKSVSVLHECFLFPYPLDEFFVFSVSIFPNFVTFRYENDTFNCSFRYISFP